MWVLVLILAALAGSASIALIVDAERRGLTGWMRVFQVAAMVAGALVGASLQRGLG